MKTEIRWVIVGSYGLYIGTHLTRADMIAQHVHYMKNDANGDRISRYPCGGKLTDAQRKAWKECQKNGDRCIRAEIRQLPRKVKPR